MSKRNMSRTATPLKARVQRERKNIDKTIEVEITNNTESMFVIKNPKLSIPKIMLKKRGDSYNVTFEELKSISASSPKMFESMSIMITDVENVKIDGELTDIEVDDVLYALGYLETYMDFKDMITKNLADNLYQSFDKGEYPSYTDIRALILESTNDGFENVMKNVPQAFRARIVEVATYVYRTKEFDNLYKVKTIEKHMGVDFFDDVDVTTEYADENNIDIS